jgi:hypothetical protein
MSAWQGRETAGARTAMQRRRGETTTSAPLPTHRASPETVHHRPMGTANLRAAGGDHGRGVANPRHRGRNAGNDGADAAIADTGQRGGWTAAISQGWGGAAPKPWRVGADVRRGHGIAEAGRTGAAKRRGGRRWRRGGGMVEPILSS